MARRGQGKNNKPGRGKQGNKKPQKRPASNRALRGLSVPQLMQRQERLQAEGKEKQAAKVEAKINKKVMRQPIQGIAVGEQYAQDAFQTNLAANRPNQVTIGGSQTYAVDPTTGQTTVTQQLSPEQQALYDQQVAQAQAANQMFMNAFSQGIPWGQQYDFSGAPQAPNVSDLNAAREQQFQQIVDLNSKPVQQEFDRQRARLEQQLYTQGHMPDSPKFKEQMEDLQRQFQPAFDNVRSQAFQQTGQELERGFNLGSQARQTYIGEQVFGRTQPMSELQQLAGFGGGPTVTPQFFGFQPVQYAAPDYLGYLGAGLDAELGRGALAVDRQQVALAGRRPAGGGGPAPIPFSIGAAPGSVPQVPNYPNPIVGGFAQGFGSGVPIGAGLATQ